MKSLQKYISSVDEAVKVDGVGIGLILRNQKDVDEAVKWLNKAATQGHSGAKSALKMIQK